MRTNSEEPAHKFIIDFGEMGRQQAAQYERPFAYVEQHVRDKRLRNKDKARREHWWRLGQSGEKLRNATMRLGRVLCIPRHAKHLLAVWVPASTLPDSAVVAFATEADLQFGILQSRIHETWAREQGTQLREAESGSRYTPRTSFETFPFPQRVAATDEAIAEAVRNLDFLRRAWLEPTEWLVEDAIEFRASALGPWRSVVVDPDTNQIGKVRYARKTAVDKKAKKQLKHRTLTLLYNEAPTWLLDAHQHLDAAVARAYGWTVDLTDQQILQNLLQLNLTQTEPAMSGTPLLDAIDHSEIAPRKRRRKRRVSG
jgi:hypothetical protein